jgi:hypothetical protein
MCSELSVGSPLDRRRALADEAIAIAEASGDDTTIVRVLNHVFLPLMVPSLLEQSTTRTTDALARARHVGDPVLLFWAAGWRAVNAASAGDIDEMDRCHEIVASLAVRLDQPTLGWAHSLTRAMRAQISGDTDRVQQLATDALQIGTDTGQPDAIVFFGAQFMMVGFLRGTMGDLIPLIDQAVADNPGVPTFKAALAVAHAEAGHTEDAARLLEDFGTADFDLPMDQGWTTGMVCYAEAAIACRNPKYAQPLFDRLAPFSNQFATTGGGSAQGPVSLYLGGLAAVLGRGDEADLYFTQAAAMSGGMGAKFFAARTDLLWGLMLADRNGPGDSDKARGLLTNAHAVAAAHGYANVERRAAEALQLQD